MSEAFLVPLLQPFFLFLLLLIAWPIKRLIQLKMKDGKLKRFLLFSWR
jgi:hypothetical protein